MYKSLPRAPVFAGVLEQEKQHRRGYDRIIRISPLPKAPVFAGVLGPVKRNRTGYKPTAESPSFCRGTWAGKGIG